MRLGIGLAMAVVAALGGASSASATTYNVTRTDDPTNSSCMTPNAGCSLRQALNAVNTSPTPPDVINLPSGTYVNGLSSELQIVNSVSIVGAGSSTTTVNGGAGSRVLHITGKSASVSIAGLTVTSGSAGGAVGGGIDVTSGTTSSSSLALDSVAIVGNTAQFGGAIGVESGSARLTITNSLLANNVASAGAGGASGGAIAFSGSNAALADVTVTANSAVGADWSTGGAISTSGSAAVSLANATIASNAVGSGGLGGNLAGTFTVKNSIVARGTGTPGSENCNGTLTSLGNNIDDTTQCFAAPASGDQLTTNPMLGSLPNQLDATSTLPLLPNSPAVNFGNPAGCTDASGAAIGHDQRGVSRPQGAICDVGAFEFRMLTIMGNPAMSGIAWPDQQLSCSQPGVISPDGRATSSLSWLRDGVTVGLGPTYNVVKADAGHQLVCQFIAVNAAGSASASAGVLVGGVVRAKETPPPTLALASKKVTIDPRTGKGTLVARCNAPARDVCILTSLSGLYGPGKLPAGVARLGKSALLFGNVRGTIAAGRSGKVTLQLSVPARRQLGRVRQMSVRLLATIRDRGGKSSKLHAQVALNAKRPRQAPRPRRPARKRPGHH